LVFVEQSEKYISKLKEKAQKDESKNKKDVSSVSSEKSK